MKHFQKPVFTMKAHLPMSANNYKIFPEKIRALSAINFQRNPAAEYE